MSCGVFFRWSGSCSPSQAFPSEFLSWRLRKPKPERNRRAAHLPRWLLLIADLFATSYASFSEGCMFKAALKRLRGSQPFNALATSAVRAFFTATGVHSNFVVRHLHRVG